MIDWLLSANLSCSDASDIIRRVRQKNSMNKLIANEIVLTLKESTPHCSWDANDRRNGI